MNISSNKYVECIYKLYIKSEEGEELQEEATIDRPLEFIYGMGLMLPDFEKNLFDKKEGDTFDFVLTPEQAYGEFNEEAVVELSKDLFVNDKGVFDSSVVYEGNTIPMMDAEGHRLYGYVDEIKEEHVVVDFNHPLAGERLHFVGEVTKVREATEADINKFFGEADGCGGGCGCNGHDSESSGCGGGCGCGC